MLAAGRWLADHPGALLAAAAAGLGAATVLLSSRRHVTDSLPAGPRGEPLAWEHLHVHLTRLAERYGDVYTVHVDGCPFVVLSSLSTVREAFSLRELSGRADVPCYKAAMNEEVFMETYSERWQRAKKSGLTAIKRVGGAGSGSVDAVLLKEVDYLVATFSQCAGAPVDPFTALNLSCGNTTCAFIWGRHYDDHEDPELRMVTEACNGWYKSLHDMSPQSECYSEDKMAALYPEAFELRAQTSLTLRKYTMKRMEELQAEGMSPDAPRSFLEFFITKRDMNEMGGIEGFADTISLYAVDPQDTHSHLLQWIVLYLASFPEEQSMLQKKIDEVVTSSKHVTNAHRAELGLVESFILEVQRHCSITRYAFLHTATEDVVFRGHNIPKDTGVLANTYAVHNEPDLFPDPSAFKAARFVDSGGHFKKSDAVLTHVIGVRQCPGAPYTRNHMFVITANLVRHFTIRPAESAGPDGPNLSPRNAPSAFLLCQPYEVVFERRSQ